MDKIYYSPKGYWKGMGAIKKLAKAAKVSEHEAYAWLSKQAIWQIYLPAPPKIIRPYYNDVSRPNEVHQADLLYLPHDGSYKYALTVIDIASRYKEAEPLKTKQANEVSKALQKIYQRSPLNFPALLQVDQGREFMAQVADLLAQHQTKIHRGLNHRDQAFVERFNRTLAERLFSYQYAQELEVGETNREWVRRLPRVISALNNEPTRLIGKKPRLAIKLKQVKQPSREEQGWTLTKDAGDAYVRYLYQPGEAEGIDEKYRATDPIWSLGVYTIEKVIKKNPPLYYLKDGPKRSFVREELMIIPADTRGL